MIKSRAFKVAFIALILTFITDMIGLWLYLFWVTNWYDIIPHFLGGVTVGAAGVWFFIERTDKKADKKKIILTAFLSGLCVGVTWEIFELYFGLTSLSDGIHYVTDTSSDLLMDMSGAVASAIFLIKN